MRNTTPVLLFKTRRPTRRHYFLRVNFRPFSFFMRTTHAKINPGPKRQCGEWRAWHSVLMNHKVVVRDMVNWRQ